MALVGDLLINVRELAPDPCGVLAAPSNELSIAVATVTGATLGAATYVAKYTLLTAWGETTGSTEVTGLIVGAGQAVQLTGTLPPGATKVRLYIGVGAGKENQFVEGTSLPLNFSTPSGVAGFPPSANLAFNPDTNGGFVTANAIYRWLNEGLKRLANIIGGIRDETGMASSVSQGLYTLTGQWLRFNSVWYDGYPLALGNAADVYRRTVSSSIPGMLTIVQNTQQLTVEVYPQPSRTALATTLNGALSASASSVILTSVAGLLSYGLLQVDSEIMAYAAISGNTLSGLQRGLGGTNAASHLTGATATELNIRIQGLRMPQTYNPGDANVTLAIPPAWETIMPTYLLYKYREAEQDRQTASSLLKEFEQEAQSVLRANRVIAGPRQIGGASSLGETVHGTAFGGLFIP